MTRLEFDEYMEAMEEAFAEKKCNSGSLRLITPLWIDSANAAERARIQWHRNAFPVLLVCFVASLARLVLFFLP